MVAATTARTMARLPKKTLLTGAIVLVVIVGAVTAWLLRGGSDAAQPPVSIDVYVGQEDRTPDTFTSIAEAEAFAMDAAGFGPLVPTYIPDGYRISLIGVSSSPPGTGATFRRVTIEMAGPGGGGREDPGGLKLLVANEPFGFPGDEAENITERPSEGSRLYRHPDGEFGPSFTLITASRGIYASSPPEGVSPDELRTVLLSYPLD